MFNCIPIYFVFKGIMQFYKINFGYTQVLFVGSVPRINRLLIVVSYYLLDNYSKLISIY